jgi:hypothetical protein
MVEGHLLAYDTCVSQAEGKSVESIKAKLCCVCRMLMLMTSQCLCPAVIFRYDRKLKGKEKFLYSLHSSTVGAVLLERYRRKHSFFKWLYLSNQA